MKIISYLLVLIMLCTLNTVYSQEYLKVNGSNHMTGSLEINKESGYSSIELKSGVGAFIDFTSDHTSDFNGRIIWNYFNSNKFDILGDVRFKDEVNLDYASANEFIVNTRFLLRKPEKIEDWNTNWGSSFVESYNAKNAPEESGWFWGLNMNHGANNESYRFNGQIAIKNSFTKPTMYFRSTTSDGTGVWAKVLTDHDHQYINGGLTLNGKLLSKEVMVRTDIEVPDYVFKEDYA
ncbi:hypothetical protein, partial [Flammeovirga sp. OC4]|uniref:hypothetical protein n=1 Tax=Flammeovirga sp. OC4 TaxID=1382345 RepID=UPI0012E02759